MPQPPSGDPSHPAASSPQQKDRLRAIFQSCGASPASPFDEIEVSPALMAVENRINQFARETLESVDDQLCLITTRIADEYFAAAAWLFVNRPNGLKAEFAHKNRHRDEFVELDGKGIAPYVARTKEPYVAPAIYDDNRIIIDKYYKMTLPETESAIAVPLLSYSGDLLGVLHLESSVKGEYQQHIISRLMLEAADLIPPLLMLRALERDDDRWFPWQSFYLHSQLFRICNDVRRALDPNGIQCAIWTKDCNNEYMMIYTTTGTSHEYIINNQLPFKSFNGTLIEMPPNAVGTVRVNQNTRVIIPVDGESEIRSGHRALIEDDLNGHYLKWRMSLGVPVYACTLGDSLPQPRATFTLACFDQQDEAALPLPEELTLVAEELGAFLTGFFALREELAITYLDRALTVSKGPTEAFGAIKEKFIEFFGLDAIAIEGILEGSESPWPITKGGKDKELKQRPRTKFLRLNVMNENGRRLGAVHFARQRPFTATERMLAERLLERCTEIFRKWGSSDDSQSNEGVRTPKINK